MTNNLGLCGTFSVKTREVPGKPGQVGHRTWSYTQICGLPLQGSAEAQRQAALAAQTHCRAQSPAPAGSSGLVSGPLFLLLPAHVLEDPAPTLAHWMLTWVRAGEEAEKGGKWGHRQRFGRKWEL